MFSASSSEACTGFLGTLISDGYKSLTVHPYIIMSAITVLALLMLSFNLFTDGLRDAFDPNQKH